MDVTGPLVHYPLCASWHIRPLLLHFSRSAAAVLASDHEFHPPSFLCFSTVHLQVVFDGCDEVICPECQPSGGVLGLDHRSGLLVLIIPVVGW